MYENHLVLIISHSVLRLYVIAHFCERISHTVCRLFQVAIDDRSASIIQHGNWKNRAHCYGILKDDSIPQNQPLLGGDALGCIDFG